MSPARGENGDHTKPDSNTTGRTVRVPSDVSQPVACAVGAILPARLSAASAPRSPEAVCSLKCAPAQPTYEQHGPGL